jgi:hypothetical protein
MTMTRPWRRITLHLSQIGFTLGLTFTALLLVSTRPRAKHRELGLTSVGLLVSVDDASACEVIRREFNDHAVLRKDPDVVLPHLPADVGEHLVTVAQFHPEHGIRQWLDHSAFDLDGPVLLGHILRFS